MRVFEGAVPLDLKRCGSLVGPPATMTLSESRIARFLCVPVMGSDASSSPLPQGPGRGPLDLVLSSSMDGQTRKVVSYTLQQRSHGKL